MTRNGATLSHLKAHTVAAYVDGTLSPADSAAVDAHLVECATCRNEIIQVEGALRPSRSRRRVYVAGLAALAAALLLMTLPRSVWVSGKPGTAEDANALAVRVRALGDVAQAPVYLGVSVRTAPDRGTQLFATGMRAYAEARFEAAVADLGRARSAGASGPAATFFLAASHTMLGNAQLAADEYARVIAMGETPYRAEAHYYRAKALLRLNQLDAAISDLERSATAGNDSMRAIAQALRDSLRSLRAR